MNVPAPALRNSVPETRSYIAPSEAPSSFVNLTATKSLIAMPVCASNALKDENETPLAFRAVGVEVKRRMF